MSWRARAVAGAERARSGGRRRWPPLVLLTALAFSALAPAQDAEPVPQTEQTAVVELHHRPPDQVLPALVPHLRDGVSLSADARRVFLRGPTAELGALIDLISALDVPPRALWVSVAADPAHALGTAPGETAGTGRRYATGTRVAPPAAGDAVRQVWRTGRPEVQRVRVLEGDWAMIAVHGPPPGPGFAARVHVTPRVEVLTGNLAPAGAGLIGALRVRPRLVGERVLLEVALLAPATAPVSLAPLAQAVATTLSVPIGEWVALNDGGGLSDPVRDTTLIARTRPASLPTLLVRVDPAD
jgi:hypothetical protein